MIISENVLGHCKKSSSNEKVIFMIECLSESTKYYSVDTDLNITSHFNREIESGGFLFVQVSPASRYYVNLKTKIVYMAL